MRVGLLWLEGPLQSWGHDSRFGRRSTLPFPTRSGILGLMCCALGREGEQREWLANMRQFKQVIVAYARHDERNRELRAAQLRDFHMVGAGYDLSDAWQKMLVPKKSDGSVPSNTSGAQLTYRFYLQDMAFACALELPANEDFEAAFAAPAWPVCLGRRCCPPSDIIWHGEYSSFEEALAIAREIATVKNRHEIFKVVDEINDAGDVIALNDVPVCFGPYKEYTDRFITIMH